MVAHGLITGMLFFVAGSVKDRFHTLEIKRLGGMLLKTPHMGWILAFCCMASLGLPGLAGFWGEFPAILASYNPGADLSVELFRTYMVIAAVGTIFAAGYLLWLLQRVAFGTPTEEFEHEHVHDLHLTDVLAWAPILVGIVVLGVWPNLIFHLTDDAVHSSLTALGR
jgi:NADH-quinone oxidoreductase subunit M